MAGAAPGLTDAGDYLEALHQAFEVIDRVREPGSCSGHASSSLPDSSVQENTRNRSE